MEGGRKNLNCSNLITKILATRNSCLGEVLGEVPKVLGGVLERETNCGNQVAEIVGSEERKNRNCDNKVAENGRKKKRIVSIKLPKSWGGIIVILAIDWRKKNIYVAIDLWQWNCQNLGEEFNSNFGNEVAKNEGGGNFYVS